MATSDDKPRPAHSEPGTKQFGMLGAAGIGAVAGKKTLVCIHQKLKLTFAVGLFLMRAMRK